MLGQTSSWEFPDPTLHWREELARRRGWREGVARLLAIVHTRCHLCELTVENRMHAKKRYMTRRLEGC
jgi:hypothetical protein